MHLRLKFNTIISFLFIVVGSYTIVAQKPCPTNVDGKSFSNLKSNVRKHVGETVAFDAEVLAVKSGYNDIPYFSATLENGEVIWIASMVSDKYVKPKAKLRLLGYIDLVQSDDAIARQYNDSGFQIRVFAMLDHSTKQMQISNAFESEVKIWIAGSIPSNRK